MHSSQYKNLYKQIDGLNNKIKKLESKKLESKKNNSKQSSISQIDSYRIHYPKESHLNKKYIGLLFESNSNNFDSDENTGEKNKIFFIKLPKSNIVINYSIQFELNFTPLETVICSVALGIKTKSESKIKIIKGSKYQFNLLSPDVVSNHIIITNTVLYSSELGEELCVITDIGSNCTVNNKKSIIKLLYL